MTNPFGSRTRESSAGLKSHDFSYSTLPILFFALAFLGVATISNAEITAVPCPVVPYSMCGIDLDRDGTCELLAGGLNEDAICAVTMGGRVLWKYNTKGMPFEIEAGDIDGDRLPEIVATIAPSKSEIIVLDRSGRLIRTISPPVIVTQLEVADLNGDSADDIIVAGYGGKVVAYDRQGRTLLDKTVDEHNMNRRMIGLEAGDINGDGQTEIAWYTYGAQLGIMDAAGKITKKSLLRDVSFCSLCDCKDVDSDGKSDLIMAPPALGISPFGDRVKVENHRKVLWSKTIKDTRQEVLAIADGKRKWPMAYGGARSAKAGNFTDSDGLEIASFNSDGKFNLLDSSGKEIIRTTTTYPFLRIETADIDNDGTDEALLSRLHYRTVYVIRFQDDTQREIEQLMSRDFVTDNVDNLLSQIDRIKTKKVRAKNHDEKLHVLCGLEVPAAERLGGGQWMLNANKRMKELANENVDYCWYFPIYERGVRRDAKGGIDPHAMKFKEPQAKLLERARRFEKHAVKFYPIISWHGLPLVSMDTVEKLLEAAPTACQGFVTWETRSNYPSGVWWDFLERMTKVARLCADHRKKLLFGEEAPFWLALVRDPKARAMLLKPEFKDVIVPCLKTCSPYMVGSEISAYVGSMMQNEIEAWGITSEEDFFPFELGLYRGCPDDVVMRQEVMAEALGASYIMIEGGHVYFDALNRKGDPTAPAIFGATGVRRSREARRERLSYELFAKGVVGPVKAGDLLSIAPVGFRMAKSPKVDAFPILHRAYGEHLFGGEGLVDYCVVSVLFNSGDYSMSRNLYGANKLMNGLFPENKYGVIPILGPRADISGVTGIEATFDSDGEHVFWGGKRMHARDAIAKIKPAFERAAAKLPFRADGVFVSARRDGKDYQVFLMDTEIFAPVNIETTVATTVPNLACYDELTGGQLEVRDNNVTLTVPAGAFRLLRFVSEQ